MNLLQAMRDPGAMLVAAVGAQYLACALVFFGTARPWMGVTYVGYCIGNAGLFMLALGYK
jgi:hypothetical protein